MSGDFFARIDELATLVGDGQLVGTVEVNQVYAHFQHERLDLIHPRGGQAKYLETPLYDGVTDTYQHIAEQVLEVGPVKPMVDNVERLSDQVETTAPVDLNNLRRSGHPTVTDGETVVYDRAPLQRRLTEAELRAAHAGQPGHHPYGHH